MTKKRIFFLFIGLLALLISTAPACTKTSHDRHDGAFVFPIVIINDESYLIVGREAGGKDRGSYCIPGGSSRGLFGREKDPLKTASRELIEELLIDWSPQESYAAIQACQETMRNDLIHKKRVVSYEIALNQTLAFQTIDDYYARRTSYPFWRISYREMDRIGLVKFDDLKKAAQEQKSAKRVMVYASVRNPKTNQDEIIEIRLRPVLVALFGCRYLSLL